MCVSAYTGSAFVRESMHEQAVRLCVSVLMRKQVKHKQVCEYYHALAVSLYVRACIGSASESGL